MPRTDPHPSAALQGVRRTLFCASLAALPLAVALASLPLKASAQAAAPATSAPGPSVNRFTGAAPNPVWEEEHAYTLGVQAFEFAWPWYYNNVLRWAWATKGLKGMSAPTAQPNVLTHQRVLTDASFRDGGRPNTDTVYSAAWIDLSREPYIISVPEMGNRYYSIELVNFDSDNFDYIGTRATGNRAGTYALVGPHWKGTLPAGVKAVSTAGTPWILALSRILVDGNADLPAVHKLQDATRLMPLSQYEGKPAADQPAYVPKPPIPPSVNPLGDWITINRLLTESPPPAREAQLMKMFAQIGVGPGQDVTKMNEAVKRGLLRASKTARMIVTSAPHYQVGRQFVNGWGMTPPNWGRPGVDGHYLVRDAKSLGGFVTHDPEENVYPALLTDAAGDKLSVDRRYELRFENGQTPPVSAFWSVTLYGEDFNFVDNPANRYALGDRSQGFKPAADGSMTIYIQKNPPGGDKDGNWLPTGDGATGNVHLVLRSYLPKPPILDGRWQPPAIKRVE